MTGIFKYFFHSLGVFTFIFIALSFTDIPYYAYHHLGTSDPSLKKNPDIIVVLGGAGMPSPDGLMRTYYGAEAAKEFPKAKIIIAHPKNEDDSLLQSKLMARELILKGIDSIRIQYEAEGFNTRSQAMNIATMLGAKRNSLQILIITSPEHMYRAIKTFKKAGIINTGGLPTFEKPIAEEKVKDKEDSKDTRVKSLDLRYNMWSYLHYELLVLKEYCAIAYYKLKGWI